MKIETSTGWFGPAAAEAWAMPSSKWRGESIEAPYTDSAAPAEASRNVRRSRPVPAGTGIPGSIVGSPLPATAAPRRSSCGRLKSLHEQLLAMSALLAGVCLGWAIAGRERDPRGASSAHLHVGEVAISMRSAFWRIAR